MSTAKKTAQRAQRRALRTKKKIHNNQGLPRVSVFRSLKQIYAQVVDDVAHKTLASCSSLELKTKGAKKEIAHKVGLTLADRVKKLGISAVIFDRGSYLYHGRVAEVAEGLREGGIKI